MQENKFSKEERERMVEMLYKLGISPKPTSSISVNHDDDGLTNVSMQGTVSELLADVSVVIVRIAESVAGNNIAEKNKIVDVMANRIKEYFVWGAENEKD